MGEENTLAGLGSTFCFCRKEDIGTENEQWHEAKLYSTSFRQFIDVPELNLEKIEGDSEGFPVSFTASTEIETNDQIRKLLQGIRKHQSRLRHYAYKTMSKSAKKALRLCHLHMKKCMFGRKSQ